MSWGVTVRSMERWMWAVFPAEWSLGQHGPCVTAMGITDDNNKAIGNVEHLLLNDANTMWGELSGPGGKVVVARRGVNAGQVVWRDRWPLNGDQV